ncbi:type I-F CRISPR-associated protein Csy1 [Ignatzschineria larvae DSM 13226]|uniref:Type I-F CRISPR-associated protein Csy1 n=1 Tax=Ignatzschineria larvae DSM 13226 TaxID=1111732 RepID=A0ABZ3C133_9GAMM|nr:type I-F CRISPR-associated protein Csy1 [Ignatzschineria larvae]
MEVAYQKEELTADEEIAFIFNARKNKREEDELESQFILAQLDKLAEMDIKPQSLNFESQKMEINVKKQELKQKYHPEIWLTWAAKNAQNVVFATHVPKLTHSIIDSSAFFDNTTADKDSYLTTAKLKSIAIDGAVRGNQYAPVYQFLELERNGKKLASVFEDLETNILEDFARDKMQSLEWNKGFSAALSTGRPTAHSLLKQVYFPIAKDGYHLLCNVVSSSQAQAIFEFMRRNTNIDYKLKSNRKYSPNEFFNFLNRANISITASNHGNASQLNGKRGGRLNLVSSQPPIWQSQLKPPIYKSSFFYELSRSFEVREIIQYLADFLSRFENLQLSIKNPKRMKWLEHWLENLSDEVLVYVKTIQTLPAGWSKTANIKLKLAHQLLLDCNRDDEFFIHERNSFDWGEVIIQDFAHWLNYRLRRANEKFTPQDAHTKLWMKLFKTNFRDVLNIKYLASEEGQ